MSVPFLLIIVVSEQYRGEDAAEHSTHSCGDGQLTSQECRDLIQVWMLISHMTEFGDAHLLGCVDAALLLPLAFRGCIADCINISD